MQGEDWNQSEILIEVIPMAFDYLLGSPQKKGREYEAFEQNFFS